MLVSVLRVDNYLIKILIVFPLFPLSWFILMFGVLLLLHPVVTNYVSFVDDYSRFCWIYLLKHKSDVEQVFYEFQAHVERLLNKKIRAIQSDWGGEYHKLHRYFQRTGISHRVSFPHTSQQNGIAERKHRHLVETGLALLAHSSLPLRYWDEAFLTACYLINRMPTPVLHKGTPFHCLLGVHPDYTFLRTFGCACWPSLRKYNARKLTF
jgi:histone deacetylase 1/2